MEKKIKNVNEINIADENSIKDIEAIDLVIESVQLDEIVGGGCKRRGRGKGKPPRGCKRRICRNRRLHR
jgi:hypothetical protein